VVESLPLFLRRIEGEERFLLLAFICSLQLWDFLPIPYYAKKTTHDTKIVPALKTKSPPL